MTLDTGALIAIERRHRFVTALLDAAERHGRSISIPAGVLAQAWRGGGRQVRLSPMLASSGTVIVALDEPAARASGVLCALTGTADVIDASVVICAAQRGDVVVTSAPDDLRRLAPSLRIFAV
ncbi:MAG: PIN domain-containing protein [Jiangellaceae bacterium]